MTDFLFLFRGGGTGPIRARRHTALVASGSWMGPGPGGRSRQVNRSSEAEKSWPGRQAVTDGPFVKSKEIVGGYLIVSAATLTKPRRCQGVSILEEGGRSRSAKIDADVNTVTPSSRSSTIFPARVGRGLSVVARLRRQLDLAEDVVQRRCYWPCSAGRSTACPATCRLALSGRKEQGTTRSAASRPFGVPGRRPGLQVPARRCTRSIDSSWPRRGQKPWMFTCCIPHYPPSRRHVDAQNPVRLRHREIACAHAGSGHRQRRARASGRSAGVAFEVPASLSCPPPSIGAPSSI